MAGTALESGKTEKILGKTLEITNYIPKYI
jgi:hypothetical protein